MILNGDLNDYQFPSAEVSAGIALQIYLVPCASGHFSSRHYGPFFARRAGGVGGEEVRGG